MNSGWAATLSCAEPCQSINAFIASTSATIDEFGVMRLCPGTTVSFSGDAIFSDSAEGAVYSWNIEGVEIPGKDIEYTFNDSGAFHINLKVTDAGGCTSVNSLNRIAQVSFEPIVTFTTTEYVNNSWNFEAETQSVSYAYDCTPPIAGTTFLPDGSGASYQSSILITCYDEGASFTSASDLESICLNMEHSYLGDLNILLISPSGQQVVLKAYSQGGWGNWLGIPVDDDAYLNPGIGSMYCFSMDANTTIVQAPTQLVTDPVLNIQGNSVLPGIYLPFGDFSSLVGSPLNGTWTILVTDNLAIDNGYIFDWTLNFAPELQPDQLSYEGQIMARGWMPTEGVLESSETTALVGSQVAGEQCFTYFVTDDFGCTYYYDQCVELEVLASADFNLSQIKVFPVPATNRLQLSGIESLNAATMTVSIFDVSGKMLKNLKLAESYDVSDLQTGVYFLKISDGNVSTVKRLIKQ